MARRRAAPFLAMAILAVSAPPSPLAGQSPDDALTALRAGEYDDAIRAYRRLAHGDTPLPEYHVGLVRALSAVGGYDDAEAAAREGVERHGVELQGTLGKVLYLRGEVAAAAAAFEAAVTGRASDRHVAQLDRAELELRRGERERAMEMFDSFIDLYNDGGANTSADLTAVATAVRYLGADDPDLFKDALRAYDEAIALDPGNLDAQVLVGELFLEKYNQPEAGASFRAVLEVNPNHPDGLLGMARSLRFDGKPGVRETVDQALDVNPNHVASRVFLAHLHLGAERHRDARAEAERALEVNPSSLEALSALAAAQFLSGDSAAFEKTRERTRRLNPGFADLYNTVADLSVDQRRYADGVELARRAVELDPSSWRGLGIMGINLLRLGRVEEARAALERAFAGDPYNVRFKNTLDLLDTYDRYTTVRTPHFELFLRDDEVDLLAPYARDLAEEAYARLVERYGYEPPLPVRLELYPSHADFSVRTAGLAGIGILGVSFGSVLAMDSPSARRVGEFNWGSTLWHELAHAFHLGMTEHRVPRWFSEGLAVHEQRKARPGWGHQPDVGFLIAYDEGKLHPVSNLNEGFVRPSYPHQVVFSYYQASLVFDLIESEYGFGAVLAMLEGYRQGRTTEALIPDVLGLSADELDDRFDAYMEARFGSSIRAVRSRDWALASRPTRAVLEAQVKRDPQDFAAHLTLGRMLLAEGDARGAIGHLASARSLFPEFGAVDGPAWFLAQALEELGDPREAANEYGRAVARNESHYRAGLEEARLRSETGDGAGAAAALELALWVNPYEIQVHRQLAELLDAQQRWADAVRERSAVVSLDPTDRAEALYQLARAHDRAGQPDDARRQVLRALELAPSYEEALELLLALRAGSSGGGTP